MKAAALLAVLIFAAPVTSFLKYQRDLTTTGANGQHYLVIDEAIWQHARADLGDLRLFAGNREIPYTLQTESGSQEVEQSELRVLQPATIGGKTQFLLDMAGIAEYDRVALRLAAKNFVAHAKVSGRDDPHGKSWAALGTTTLYDLSDENLGHNGTLQIPLSTYKFLQVSIDGSVKPGDVLGATAGITRSEKAVWRAIGDDPSVAQQGKDTLLTFTVPENAPVDRIVFDIDPAQPNFRRDLSIEDAQGETIRNGELVRVHMQRGGQKIDVDGTFAYIGASGQKKLMAVVHNGDDPPLKITGVHLQQYEHRVYFEAPAAESGAVLYYGDPELTAPVYDYAKFFQKDTAATRIDLGGETLNADFRGRQDERPWSERHPAILWGAILAAVLVLGVIAIKSIRSAAS